MRVHLPWLLTVSAASASAAAGRSNVTASQRPCTPIGTRGGSTTQRRGRACSPPPVRASTIASTVACPIVVDNVVWGRISVGSTTTLPGSGARLTRFTELVAIAISNAAARAEHPPKNACIVEAHRRGASEDRARPPRRNPATARSFSALTLKGVTAMVPRQKQVLSRCDSSSSQREPPRRVRGRPRDLARAPAPQVLAGGGARSRPREPLHSRSPIPVNLRFDVP